MVEKRLAEVLRTIYERLMSRYGPQHWWPAEEPFEVIVGAILTQSAAWQNVVKAIANLKAAGALSPGVLATLPLTEIERLIRPSGYYRAKSKKLQAFAQWLGENYQYELDRFFSCDMKAMRRQLLGIHGIGPETADSIILYAANKPVFVVDAYTRRILKRIGILKDDISYDRLQDIFMSHLPHDVRMFNEYHALLVQLGKSACRSVPLCENCCLNLLCEFSAHGICNDTSLSVKLSAGNKSRKR